MVNLLVHMGKKFEVNQTKIKGGCQWYTKAAPQQSWSDLTLADKNSDMTLKKDSAPMCIG